MPVPTPTYTNPAELMTPDSYQQYLTWKSQYGAVGLFYYVNPTDGLRYSIDAFGNISLA